LIDGGWSTQGVAVNGAGVTERIWMPPPHATLQALHGPTAQLATYPVVVSVHGWWALRHRLQRSSVWAIGLTDRIGVPVGCSRRRPSCVNPLDPVHGPRCRSPSDTNAVTVRDAVVDPPRESLTATVAA
jgi:hypothetical protein